MSCLVNYGSSDESEGSDGEDFPSLPAKSKDMDLKAKHADVTPSSIPKSSLFASLPKPKGPSTPAMEEVGSESGSSNKKSLFSGLPPPKKTGSANPNSAAKMSAAKPNLAQESTGLLTDNKTVSKGLLNLPPPKKKQPVKISLPALPDPDSDDDEPEAKRPKSTKGTGLFAMLPKPKIASRREAQRPLIPYTLTKKPAAAPTKPPGKPSTTPKAPAPSAKPSHPVTSTAVQSKPSGSNPLVMGYNSDDDDEEDGDGVNFFSMGGSDDLKQRTMEESTKGAQRKPVASNPLNLSSQGSKASVEPSATESDTGTSRTTMSGADPGVEAAPGITEPTVPPTNDQPLVFNSSKTNNAGYSLSNYSHHAMYNPQYNAQSLQGSNYAQASEGSQPYGLYSQTGLDSQGAMQYYNQPYQEGADTGYNESATSSETSSQSFLQDERFAKMVGKNKRGKEEIQFIDIKADDQIGPTAGLQDMVKSMTEEKEYRGKLKKEQLPTSQQKRKHQITYLARQAKERELELKNQWAENRQNRKSTNAKYGFF
ncbi:proline-rich protein PRCC-like [Lytechinus variegatus]|uniref:proline-rich protein PRCC-like n=1 Tax=Lytechinus variegatus TaxID=7654 RepID=UPI001BB2839F|nr:proline-rich protein PRCC-like [Lytechinus variegatus]XP_041464691.1 proline-rich protein PRCC-like [Lytechinus variegatus]